MRLPRIIHRWSLRLSFPLLAFFLLSSVILLHNSSRLSAKNLRKKVVFNSFPASFRDLRHHLRLYGEDSDADILDVEVYGQDPADHELPGLHVADRSAQRHHRGPDRDGKRRLAEHKLRDDGLLQVNPEGRHPIHDLIEDAKERWQSKIEKQSLTILEAVREYKRRYNRDPPLGFDHWWRFVVENDVQLPDDYDRIYHDIEPFWGIRPADLRKLIAEHESEPGTYTLGNHEGYGEIFVVNSSGVNRDSNAAKERSDDQIWILDKVKQFLPPFRATFTFHDASILFAGHDLRSEAVDAASVGDYIDIDKQWDNRHLGWVSACPNHSPLRRHPNISSYPDLEELHAARPKTFIYDHPQSMDPCKHITHVHLNGQLTNYGVGPPPRPRLHPSFSMSTTPLHSDILAVAPEMWTDSVGEDPLWEDKSQEELLWRGTTTGTRMEEKMPWKLSQRLRLVAQTNQQQGTYGVLRSFDEQSPIGDELKVNAKELNERLMNIGFSGEPAQCTPEVCEEIAKEYAFRERQTWEEANQWKYILDIDGNGWSARFKRLITSNSLILKATICPEWFSERIMPWVHYVPVKMDLTDLFDIMTFFRGDVEGNEGHDQLAKEIAYAGANWSDIFWRQEDMTAYMFRLFLEWARVSSLDRDKMSFKLPDEPSFND